MAGDVAGGLVARVLAGDRLALARLMTLVENRAPELPDAMSRLYAHTSRAHVVGITGPPGAGKSRLADAIKRGAAALNQRSASGNAFASA